MALWLAYPCFKQHQQDHAQLSMQCATQCVGYSCMRRCYSLGVWHHMAVLHSFLIACCTLCAAGLLLWLLLWLTLLHLLLHLLWLLLHLLLLLLHLLLWLSRLC